MPDKEYWKKYARDTAASRRSAANDTSDIGGTEEPGGDLLSAAESYDGFSEESGDGFSAEQSISSRSSSLQQESLGSTEGADGGVDFYDLGGHGTLDSDWGRDFETGNSRGHGGKSSSGSVRSGGRTKRVSYIDEVLQKTSTKAPKSTIQKTITTVRKVLTIAEVTKNRKDLVDLIIWSSDNLDNGISAITKGHRQVEIWSDLSYVDAEILADSFLQAGQKSEKAAAMVRKVMDIQKRIKVGVILAPRIYKSIIYTVLTGIDLRM